MEYMRLLQWPGSEEESGQHFPTASPSLSPSELSAAAMGAELAEFEAGEGGSELSPPVRRGV